MDSVIRKKSFDFALAIISLYQELQRQHEYAISEALAQVEELIRILTSIVKTTSENP